MHLKTWIISLISIIVLVAGFVVVYLLRPSYLSPIGDSLIKTKTVSEIVNTYSPNAEERLLPYFSRAGVSYPPSAITLIAIKDESRLELWAESKNGHRLIRAYVIQALSGGPGPKLREGDRQVPEGLYKIEGLNPNSHYHLSMKLNYPNDFDRRQASIEGRQNLGGDIFIHGKAVSIGCLAMGDQAIEELFILVSKTQKENVKVIIAPSDFRKQPLAADTEQPEWVKGLYENIEKELVRYQL